MKQITYPPRSQWTEICRRPAINSEGLYPMVQAMFEAIRTDGDRAIQRYSLQFDHLDISEFKVDPAAIREAVKSVPETLKSAIQLAASNIRTFHAQQQEKVQIVETMPGVSCWRESRAIERVGIYVPGGSAPLFSTVLMLGIPAQLAGCSEIILCTPANATAEVAGEILYAAQLVGIQQIYRIGGIQAIAAMAFGTETVPQVDKLFGPGNQYVTAAKQLVQQYGIAIDMPAGPSEVLIIADQTANPAFVAADLLAQAEHGPDSQVILLSDQDELIKQTLEALSQQLALLPRSAIAQAALQNSRAVLLEDMDECMEFSNQYAPEHLILAVENARARSKSIRNAGSVFLGHYTCESAGDYASGTNHTLPTNGFAKAYSGVSLDSFLKKITFQEIDQEGIQHIGPAIMQMAEAEQLMAHSRAVSIRLAH
ncbi:MAG: histidinol dehydrogenase [Bacteroidota bacterium]